MDCYLMNLNSIVRHLYLDHLPRGTSVSDQL